MMRPGPERKPQVWVCSACGTTNFSPYTMQCVVCLSPSSDGRAKKRLTRRVLLSSLVVGATILGGGFWLLSTELTPVQSVWEVSLDPGSTLSGLGDLHAPVVAWSPDGKLIACSAMIGNPANKGVMVIDGKTAHIVWSHQEAHVWFDAIAWSPSGTHLALAGRSNVSSPSSRRPSFIQIWQVQGWQKVAAYPVVKSETQGHLACGYLAWSPNGTYLAGFNESVDSLLPPSVQIWNSSNGDVLFHQEVSLPGRNLFLSWLPDSHALVTSWRQGELDIWDIYTGGRLFHREPDALSVMHIAGNTEPFLVSRPNSALSPDGQRIAFCTVEQGQLGIQVWDLSTSSLLFRCQPVPGRYWCLTWSPDGRYLAVCQEDHASSICFWGKLALTYPSWHADQLIWSPAGHVFALVSARGVWHTSVDTRLTVYRDARLES